MTERWSQEREDELKRLWNEERRPKSEIRRIMGLSAGQLEGKAMRLNLHYGARPPINWALDHPTVRAMRTRHVAQVREPTGRYFILKPGLHQRKLGARVEKGKWKGMAFYSLTLEERATCPEDCALLAVCYGNGMHNAARYRHGFALEERLLREIAHLEVKHHGLGFVVRLHILGDFYSVEYVAFWRKMLELFPSLHVFGYTAWSERTAIGRAVALLRDEKWDRFAVRTSGGHGDATTIVIDTPSEAHSNGIGMASQRTADAVICPVETGKTRSCGTCGVCWSTRKPVAFLRH